MLTSTSILQFGCDLKLLGIREQVLASAGFDVETVHNFAAYHGALTDRHFDLLLCCHSLSRTDCEAALGMASEEFFFAPRLVLSSGFSLFPVLPGTEKMDVLRGPAALIARVRILVSPPPNPESPKEIDMAQFDGQVRWFNNAKGYGFVGRNDGGKDVFTHYSAIQTEGYKTLKEGDRVSFDIIDGEKGPQADKVEVFRKV